MGSYQVQRGNKLQSSRLHYLLLTGCICIFLLGCGNPSRKKLSRILEQTETLAILSVPDRCEPHFYPSSEFSWDGMWGGVSKGATDGFEEIPDFVWEYDYYPLGIAALIYSFVRVPAGAIGGGVSKAREMPHLMKCHFRYVLSNAFEDRNPCEQVSRRIYANCTERKPELNPQQEYWSDREGANYGNASSRDSEMKGVYSVSYSSGNQMLLKIHGTDYGLAGATSKNTASYFFMIIQAELIRIRDGKRIYCREFEYKKCFTWT